MIHFVSTYFPQLVVGALFLFMVVVGGVSIEDAIRGQPQ